MMKTCFNKVAAASTCFFYLCLSTFQVANASTPLINTETAPKAPEISPATSQTQNIPQSKPTPPDSTQSLQGQTLSAASSMAEEGDLYAEERQYEEGSTPIYNNNGQYNSYYKRYARVKNLTILAGGASDASILEAVKIIWKMLKNRPDVIEVLGKDTVVLVIGKSEKLTDHPYYAGQPSWINTTSGVSTPNTTSITECNLMNLSCDRHWDQSVLEHELAHTALDTGMAQLQASFVTQVQNAYNAAISAGKWRNTYAGTNYKEYWAIGMQCFWNVSADGPAGGDGNHNNISTNSELKTYDPVLYNLLQQFLTKPLPKATIAITGANVPLASTQTVNVRFNISGTQARGTSLKFSIKDLATGQMIPVLSSYSLAADCQGCQYSLPGLNLIAGRNYQVQITAASIYGNTITTLSSPFTAMPVPATSQGIITNLTPQNFTLTNLYVSGTSGQPTVLSFSIKNLANENTQNITLPAQTVNADGYRSYNFSGLNLIPNNPYALIVRASNAYGTSQTLTIPFTPAVQLQLNGFHADPVGNGVNLVIDNISGLYGYASLGIEIRDPLDPNFVINLQATATSNGRFVQFVPANLIPGRTYQFFIRGTSSGTSASASYQLKIPVPAPNVQYQAEYIQGDTRRIETRFAVTGTNGQQIDFGFQIKNTATGQIITIKPAQVPVIKGDGSIWLAFDLRSFNLPAGNYQLFIFANWNSQLLKTGPLGGVFSLKK